MVNERHGQSPNSRNVKVFLNAESATRSLLRRPKGWKVVSADKVVGGCWTPIGGKPKEVKALLKEGVEVRVQFRTTDTLNPNARRRCFVVTTASEFIIKAWQDGSGAD